MTTAAPFALAPALVTTGVIDYSVAHGAKLFHEAVRPLSEMGYGVQAEGLMAFLAKVKTRSQSCGCNNIIKVPEDAATDPLVNLHDLLDAYGEITLDQIISHAKTYIKSKNRSAQNSMQLYHCLTNSLSEEGMSKVNIWESQYTVDNIQSGPALLKVIIRESLLDTNATVRNIRQQLSSLDTYLPTIGHDISKMNMHVKELIQKLTARGQTTQDLLVNLFKGYSAASDDVFTRYIEKKEEEYDDGTNITPNEHMQLAANKYKTLRE